MFYHIIDHNGFGTMHKLVIPLCETCTNHQLVAFDSSNGIQKVINDRSAHIIIHSTASKKSNFIYNFLKYFNNRQVYIFMHVSTNYEIYKGRAEVIEYLKYLTDNFSVTILTPSKEVTNQYLNFGIKAETIQLGIDARKIEMSIKTVDRLKPFYNKIITTCSSDNDEYKYIKGTDIYEKFIFDNNLLDLSLIAGTNNAKDTRIPCKKFDENDFLNVLAHSIMYVQFSRFESYNITATYAKMMKKPVLLLNTEGAFSCMNGVVYDDITTLTKEALSILKNGPDYDLIENLYCDSMQRENIKKFNLEFQKLVGRKIQ